jgi:hypothetical protein
MRWSGKTMIFEQRLECSRGLYVTVWRMALIRSMFGACKATVTGGK